MSISHNAALSRAWIFVRQLGSSAWHTVTVDILHRDPDLHLIKVGMTPWRGVALSDEIGVGPGPADTGALGAQEPFKVWCGA